MKAALITPTPLLNKFATRSKYQFVLAHVYAHDPMYRAFYMERALAGDSIIVDNGAYEFGEAIDLTELIECARELHPDVIVLPDVRFDREKTLARTGAAMKQLKGLGKHLIGVPQGKNREDILECYKALTAMGVDGYGLYEEIGDVAGLGTRTDFCQYLEDNGYVDETKYYHLLGMEEDLTQIADLAQFLWVDGIDSCKAIVYGLSGIELTAKGTDKAYPHRPKDYFSIAETRYEAIIQNNITRVLGWANQ